MTETYREEANFLHAISVSHIVAMALHRFSASRSPNASMLFLESSLTLLSPFPGRPLAISEASSLRRKIGKRHRVVRRWPLAINLY